MKISRLFLLSEFTSGWRGAADAEEAQIAVAKRTRKSPARRGDLIVLTLVVFFSELAFHVRPRHKRTHMEGSGAMQIPAD
jgi:hypothetical protein